MLGDNGKCVDKWARGRDGVYAAGDEKYRDYENEKN